jgi:putative transposase
VYLKAYEDGREARISLGAYFRFYNTSRPHQSMGYRTPAEVYTGILENTFSNMVESVATNTGGMAGLSLNKAPILYY